MVVLHVRGNKRAIWLGAISLVLYVVVSRVATGPERTPYWLVGYALAWGLYLALFVRPRGDDFVASPAVIVAWALLARLVLVGTHPWLSDDLYRYLLDGRVLAAGINPYRYAPADPIITRLAGDLAAKVNHPDVRTIYPPLIQLVGLVAAWLHVGVVGWRILMTAVDAGVIWAVVRLFGAGARGWRAAAVYGLCPLAIWETGANGHLEPLVALPLVLAAWLWHRHPTATGFALGGAILAKFYPLVLVGAWVRSRRFIHVTSIAAVVTAAGLLPFAAHGVDIFAGMKTYLATWTFNSPLYSGLEKLTGQRMLLRALPFLVIGVAGWVAGLRREDPVRMIPLLLFGLLVLGATLHPWYALWVLPWLGDRPHPGLWSFTAAMGGAYAVWWEVARSGRWELPTGVAVLLWGIVALGWLAAWWHDSGEDGQVA
jgi:alpha-1,6-mannosyltransferase